MTVTYMARHPAIEAIKRVGAGLAFLAFPLIFIVAYATHPNLLNLRPVTDVDAWSAEVRGNTSLHLGHVLMLLSVPLLIVVALTFLRLLHDRRAWMEFVGGALAVVGATILATDKGTLSLTISAFDILSDAQFAQLRPGLSALQERAGCGCSGCCSCCRSAWPYRESDCRPQRCYRAGKPRW